MNAAYRKITLTESLRRIFSATGGTGTTCLSLYTQTHTAAKSTQTIHFKKSIYWFCAVFHFFVWHGSYLTLFCIYYETQLIINASNNQILPPPPPHPPQFIRWGAGISKTHYNQTLAWALIVKQDVPVISEWRGSV